jgi:hypothetical protein
MERSFLLETPPYCPTAECFVHGMARNYVEHHVEGCPISESFAGRMHLFSHAVEDAHRAISEALNPALTETRDFLLEWYRSLPWLTRVRVELRIRWDRFYRWVRS